MYPPNSGYHPPNILNFSSSCDATTGASVVSFTCNKQVFGVPCSVDIFDNSTGQRVWSDALPGNINARAFTVSPPLPNGAYYILADNTEASTNSAVFEVDCTPVTPSSCSINVVILGVDPPTSAGGSGQVRYRVSGTVDNQQSAAIFNAAGGLVNGMAPYGDGDFSAPVPPNGIGVLCTLTVNEQGGIAFGDIATGCFAQADFTIPDFAAPPTTPDVTEWFAVGGLLPNPARLACLVTSLATLGPDPANPTGPQISLPRAGLHLELELFRLGQPDHFARVRKTVRSTTELVDVARYLWPQLAAVYGYAPRSIAYDPDALLAFTYRYREVDATGAGPWVDKLATRYAVLAGLPGYLDPMRRYVGDPTTPGLPMSSFRELVHNIGFPLEVSILIPGDRPVDLYLEHRYFDAGGNEVAIASWTVPAGDVGAMVRFPHIDYAIFCAVKAESALVNIDRSYAGVCAGLPPLPPPTGGNRINIGAGYLTIV